jgi:hypothetical protein
MKALILALTLTPGLALAAAPAGQSKLKLDTVSESLEIREKALKKELQAVDAELAVINEEIELVRRQSQVVAPFVAPGLANVRDSLATIETGLDIERTQILKQRRALLSEKVTTP